MVSLCPIALVNAPAERVWALLSEPASYATWWDADTVSILPAGPAKIGQEITARTVALGRQWPVRITVEGVNADHRTIDLTTRLPFGITVHNHITVTPAGDRVCRVSFG